jgi:hypothetical protein
MRHKPSVIDDAEISEQYDREDDIYYVTVKTGEPSVVTELDDKILFEAGIFTGMPTGFRILNYSKHKVEAGVFRRLYKEFCKKAGVRKNKEFELRQSRFDKIVEKAAA